MIFIRNMLRDLPSALKWNVAESTEAVSRRLREWTADLDTWLRRQPEAEVREVPFIGGTTKLAVTTPLRPVAVILGGLRLKETPGVNPVDPSGAGTGSYDVTLQWLPIAGGYSVESITGLTDGVHYVLTLVAIGANNGNP